jgi:hypothetical protein
MTMVQLEINQEMEREFLGSNIAENGKYSQQVIIYEPRLNLYPYLRLEPQVSSKKGKGGDTMKKKFAILAVSALVASCLLMSSTVLAGKDGNGNGFPSGPHYNLNILGKEENKWQYNESEEGNNTIFVRLDNKSQIWMIPTKGTEFVVTDADAVNKDKGKYDAEFEIPYNKSLRYPAYDVYVRARGKPGGYVNISAEFLNLTDNTTWLSMGTVEMLSHNQNGKGRPKPVAQCINNLFYVTVDGSTYWLFDHPEYNETLYQYFWDYDNHGCKLLQVRFYENTSYVPPEPTT